jgi:hypothetical protein
MLLAMLWLDLGLWCLTPHSTILLVEEAGVPGENHRPTESHSQTLSHILYRIHLGVRTHNVSGDRY